MSGENGTKPKTSKKRKFRPGKLLAWCGAAAAIALVCVTIGYVAIIINGKQFMEKYKDKMVMAEASKILDVNDQEVGVLYQGENRELVEYNDIPPKLADAFKATEDRRFDKHAGVDFWGVGRALVKDVVHHGAVEGGSTITQQLAKNMFLTYDKTFFRKATEASIALALENRFTKEEIMTMYLNRIYFGRGAYGIKVAAKQYFGVTNLNDLKVWQMATLAGIPKSPSNYNPIDNPDKSKERRGVVLKLMYDQGYITEQEKNEAMDVDYTPLPQQAGSKKDYQTFRDYVIKEAQDLYGIEEDQLRRGGYKIKTTMDANAQKIMEQSFENKNLFLKDGPEQKSQSSMVIVNNKDGGIVAMIGGRDYVDKGLNRAVDVPRQPGSSFKPIVVYGPALESGNYYPNSMLKDEESDYNGYSPRNYDGVYRGEVDMSEAVRKSINAPAVWLLNEIGLNKGMQFAKNLGIPFDPKDKNLAIALGGMTKGVTPLQMAQAYSAFANGGFLNKAHAIREIINTDGVTVNAFKGSKTKVMSPKTSYYMTQLLQGVVDSGTGTAAKMNRPAAGKTGTTQLDLKGLEKFNRDIWFVGYTPEWSAAVWMGFDKTDSKHYISSGTALPAALFKEVMSKALAKVPVTSFPKPDGVDVVKETPKPSGTTLSAAYVKESRKVRLTWTKDDTAGGGAVQVFRKETKDPDFVKILEVNGGTEANDISIQPGKTYQYYVVSSTQSGSAGDRSNIVDVAVPLDADVSPLPSLSPGPGDASGKPGDNGKGGKSPKTTPVPGQSGPAPTPKPTADSTVQPPASTNPGGATQADPKTGTDPAKVSIDLPADSKQKESEDRN